MRKRERAIQKKFFVSEEENEILKQKMELIGYENFSQYARKMLLNGQVINVDMTPIKDLTREINAIGKNINQVARICNETHSVYGNEMTELQDSLNQMFIKISQVLERRNI